MNDVLELKGFYDISANQKEVVWFDVATCIAVVRMVLVRALKTQVTEAVEAIEALKTVPEVDDPLVPVTAEDEAEDGLEKRKGRTGKAPKPKNKPVVTGDDNPLIFSFYSRIVNPLFSLAIID